MIDEGFDLDGGGCIPVDQGGLDCNDSDPAINPDADEIFDGIDNNCNGIIDEGFED